MEYKDKIFENWINQDEEDEGLGGEEEETTEEPTEEPTEEGTETEPDEGITNEGEDEEEGLEEEEF